MSEKELIDIWKKLVEQKLQMPLTHSWKQRDFEYLSDLIFDKTGTRLSISTLKRIWKEPENRMPQTYTLNVLANFLEFESWTDFKLKHISSGPGRRKQEIFKKPFIRRVQVKYLLGLVIIAIISGFFIFYQPAKSFKESDIVFKSRKNIPSGVPNTVVFEYDISKADFDSAFIQQSWDKRIRAAITKNNHFQTFIYYYPGYHTARLLLDGKVAKKEFVNITTSGWEALVDGFSPDGLPQYLPKDSIIKNESLYLSRETLLNNNIQVEDKTFWTNYFNVGNFSSAESEDFVLETTIKNSLKDGALVCQYVQLGIICENGLISIPFCNPGCASNIHLHISEVFKEGKKNDLSPFGIELSDWRNVQIKGNKKTIIVSTDNRYVDSIQYTKELGKIKGLHYKFYGCGAVDKVALYSGNRAIYSNRFSNAESVLQ
jgi:hypothetical protein